MGHRHFTNTFDMFGINQGHNHNHSSAEQSYVPLGGAVPSENISFVSPMDNMSRSGGNCDSHWNSEGRANEYSSSNFSMQVQHLPPPFSTRPYDPHPHSSVSRNLYPAQPINVPLVHSSYYNRPTTHDVEVGLLDPTTTTVRGAYKRKSPSFNGACERGSTNRFSGAGSSSSSQLLLENPTSDYQSIPLPGPIGLTAQYGGSSSLSVPGEDSMRNVRSRSGLYIEPNTTRTHLPTYPSHHYHSTTLPRNPSNMVNLGNLSADVTSREWTHVPLSATSHGRLPTSDTNGSSYETNRFVVGGSTADIGSCPRDYISSGPPVSSSRYLHGPHAQATREGSSYHSLRATPSYRATSLSYSHLGHEAAASMDNGLHSHSESFSSRYSRTASAGGLRNSYRNGRSRIAVDRLQSISSVVYASSEFLMAGDRSPIYDGSRASYDQYRDMRLDVDSMSYEELLALGERIGDVSTGVSEDLMSNCLVEKVYCSSDQNHMEENCAICLEEYKAGEGIGTLKNCGHGYHVGCIRKWLMMKNVCPICKADALKDC